eukprot:13978717-Alexandrium_andersonii.AAC.1
MFDHLATCCATPTTRPQLLIETAALRTLSACCLPARGQCAHFKANGNHIERTCRQALAFA